MLTIGFNVILLSHPVVAKEVFGKAIAFSCSGCHGTDGKPVRPGIPKLKSQSAKDMEEKLLDFKYDKKTSSIMGRIAKGYTDSELQSVAKYFSGL